MIDSVLTQITKFKRWIDLNVQDEIIYCSHIRSISHYWRLSVWFPNVSLHNEWICYLRVRNVSNLFIRSNEFAICWSLRLMWTLLWCKHFQHSCQLLNIHQVVAFILSGTGEPANCIIPWDDFLPLPQAWRCDWNHPLFTNETSWWVPWWISRLTYAIDS